MKSFSWTLHNEEKENICKVLVNFLFERERTVRKVCSFVYSIIVLETLSFWWCPMHIDECLLNPNFALFKHHRILTYVRESDFVPVSYYGVVIFINTLHVYLMPRWMAYYVNITVCWELQTNMFQICNFNYINLPFSSSLSSTLIT